MNCKDCRHSKQEGRKLICSKIAIGFYDKADDGQAAIDIPFIDDVLGEELPDEISLVVSPSFGCVMGEESKPEVIIYTRAAYLDDPDVGKHSYPTY